ncbi:MAG: flagellar biosynthetic protein FliR [Halocynthiibacter sp.]
MINDLASITSTSTEIVVHFIALFFRMGAVMALMPIFGQQAISVRVRLALAVAFAFLIFPIIPATEVAPVPLITFGAEAVNGLAIGAFFRAFYFALQIAGTIIAQSSSLSQIFGGPTVDPQPAVGNLIIMAGMALAALSGIHIDFIGALVKSYTLFPIGVFPSPETLGELSVAHVLLTFEIAFTLSLPFLIAALIYNLALGIINKAMPQLMVAFVGAPAITLGGLVILFLILPLILNVWYQAFYSYLQLPFEVF